VNAVLNRLWHRLLRRIGAQGLIGLVLLVAALVLIAWAPSLLREAAELRETAQARHTALLGAIRARDQQPSAQQQMQKFSASFPTRDRNAEDLREVFAAARRHEVALNKGEYQFNADPASPFVTYAATFPVREGYGDIKKFTSDVLRSLPHAAMEELRLERSDAGATVLDARIRITLIYRAS
jgi:hypothetical protein